MISGNRVWRVELEQFAHNGKLLKRGAILVSGADTFELFFVKCYIVPLRSKDDIIKIISQLQFDHIMFLLDGTRSPYVTCKTSSD